MIDKCKIVLWSMVFVLPLAAHTDHTVARTDHIYVCNSAGNTVDVIDPAMNKIVQVIPDMEAPEVARFSPDGTRVYITRGGENSLAVLDQETGKQIKKVPLSGWANDVATTRDGKFVLVCIRNASNTSRNITGALDIIDATSLEKVKSIPTKSGLHDIDVTGDSRYAVAGSPEGESITVFDLQSEEIAWELPFDQHVQTLVIENGPNGSGNRIFVNLFKLNGFAVVDFEKRAEVARIKNPDQPSGYPHDNFHSASHGIGIAPNGKTLWVNDRPGNCFFVYALPDLKVLGFVPLHELTLPGQPVTGAEVDWITFTSDSETAYLANGALNSVSVIDVTSRKEVALIPVGQTPHRISTQSGSSITQSASGSSTLDYELFKSRVEPIFLKTRSAEHARCYVCHENRKHHTGLNLEPLAPGSSFWTEEQSRRNFVTVSGLVVPGNPAASIFPMHPLAPEAGGDIHVHGGGRQFETQDDPDFQAIVEWIRGH
jgi:YVTN family beta-propeller protein